MLLWAHADNSAYGDGVHQGVHGEQNCAAKARAVLPTELLTALEAGRAGDEAFRRLTRAEEKSLLGSLLRLRQACCHPQVSPLRPHIA